MNEYGLLDDPKTLGLLSLGLRLMSTPGKFPAALGVAGQGALGDVLQRTQVNRESKRRDELAKLQANELAMRQSELTERMNAAKTAAAEREAQDKAAQQAALLRAGYLSSVSGDAGPPEPFNAAKALMFLKPDEVKTLEPPKPEKITQPAAVQEYLYAVQNGYKGSFEQWKQSLRPPGAEIKVDLGAGQKGFENTVTLGEKFKNEPIYKDYQDVSSAHRQIKVSLSQASPIGDTAAATKIMKILDPGSVVRESELGMAMAAAGKLDRMQNYVQMWVRGDKLTPQQRKDFGVLADELARATEQAFTERREHYVNIAKAYGLDPDLSLGKVGTTQKRIKFSELPNGR